MRVAAGPGDGGGRHERAERRACTGPSASPALGVRRARVPRSWGAARRSAGRGARVRRWRRGGCSVRGSVGSPAALQITLASASRSSCRRSAQRSASRSRWKASSRMPRSQPGIARPSARQPSASSITKRCRRAMCACSWSSPAVSSSSSSDVRAPADTSDPRVGEPRDGEHHCGPPRMRLFRGPRPSGLPDEPPRRADLAHGADGVVHERGEQHDARARRARARPRAWPSACSACSDERHLRVGAPVRELDEEPRPRQEVEDVDDGEHGGERAERERRSARARSP